MNYLRVKNFWDYQNADVWKKAKANRGGHKHPAWCKFYVARDMELDRESPMTRLVFYELLRLATVCENAILNDSEAIAKRISLPRNSTAKAIDRLLEMGWLSQTRTRRSSRNSLESLAKVSRPDREKIREEEITTRSSNGYVMPEFALTRLLRALIDQDSGTEGVIKALAHRFHFTESDLAWALECATGPGVESPTRVAVAELKKRGEAKEVA